jgi:hypothetical protein
MLSARLIVATMLVVSYSLDASLQATPSAWIHRHQLVIGYNLCLLQSAYSCQV